MEKKMDADINCYQLGIQDIVQDYFKKPRNRNSGHPELIVNLQNHLEKCVKMDRQFKAQKIFDEFDVF